MPTKRSRELRPLSSEHHQALLVAFQLKKAIAGHAETAGAPRDLDGLTALARRFEESVFLVHIEAEEELLGRHLSPADARRLKDEHRQLRDLLAEARSARQASRRAPLLAFADLLERHVRWEERELFQRCEEAIAPEELVRVGHELERRLVVAGKGARRPSS
jgi:hemerythrin-like domain-containing protein